MIRRDTLFVFLFLFVIATAILNAGLYLNDEWATAAALDQIAEGHQFKINEGKYGYYANGTPTQYMEYRNERLMYPITLPLIALPIHTIFSLCGDNFRVVIVVAWIFALLASMYILSGYMEAERFIPVYAIASILGVINLLLCTQFQWVGRFVPNEVISLVFTNIILFAVFGATIYQITKEMFKTTSSQIFATIATISCSSALFWAGTAKDHVFVMLLIGIVALLLIRYSKTKNIRLAALATLTSSILVWERPEIGIGVLAVAAILIGYFHRDSGKKMFMPVKDALIVSVSAAIGLALFAWNNLVVSGSIFITPFMFANVGYSHQNISTGVYSVGGAMACSPAVCALRTLLFPASGAAGIIVIIPLIAIFVALIFAYKRYNPDSTTAILVALSLGAIAYYVFKGSFTLQSIDTGIFPDERYTAQIYALITLIALDIIYKIYTNINYKTLIKNTLLTFGLVFSVSILIVGILTSTFPEQAQFNTLMTVAVFAAIAIYFISLINDFRRGTQYFYITIPLLISIPLTWNIISIIMYASVKVASYPSFLPIMEFLHGLVF